MVLKNLVKKFHARPRKLQKQGYLYRCESSCNYKEVKTEEVAFQTREVENALLAEGVRRVKTAGQKVFVPLLKQ